MYKLDDDDVEIFAFQDNTYLPLFPNLHSQPPTTRAIARIKSQCSPRPRRREMLGRLKVEKDYTLKELQTGQCKLAKQESMYGTVLDEGGQNTKLEKGKIDL